MPVDTKHPSYIAAEERWATMRDVIEGEDAVKARGTAFLPKPSEASDDQYKAYKLRAVFVRTTGRTSKGLNGAIYRKAPTIELPSTLEYMKEDADGAGQGLEQVSKELSQEILDEGRAGLMLDRPVAISGSTKEDDLKNKLRANLSIYKTESIINWKTVKFGGATILTMVVLLEIIQEKIDEFASESKKQYRVLAFDEEGYYYQQLYNEDLEAGEVFYPTKKEGGAKWDRIPFEFIGSEDNTVSVDDSPLYGMASLNLAQYRNSADYEEGVYMMGQPTLFVDPGTMTAEQFNKLNPNGITVGSKRGVTLGEGGQPHLVTMQANSAAYEAIGQKTDQMVSIGAKIVQAAGKNQTAEEARINAAAEHSLMNTIVGNVDDAINTALKDAIEFEGGNPEEVDFKLNREFFPETMSAQEATALIMLADRSDIAQSDIRDRLKRTGWLRAGRTDEDIDNEIEGQGL